MKKLFFTLGILIAGFSASASTPIYTSNLIENIAILDKQKIENQTFVLIEESIKTIAVVDCTIRIKGNFDGQEIDLEITVHDVTWAGCQYLKAAVKAALASQ